MLQKKLRSKAVLLGGLVLLLFFSVHFIRSRSSRRVIDQEIGNLETRASQLERGNRQLAELIKYLNSPAYLEEKARTDLGLRKAGERAVVISDLGTAATAAETNRSATTSPTTSNLQRWWRYFFAKE